MFCFLTKFRRRKKIKMLLQTVQSPTYIDHLSLNDESASQYNLLFPKSPKSLFSPINSLKSHRTWAVESNRRHAVYLELEGVVARPSANIAVLSHQWYNCWYRNKRCQLPALSHCWDRKYGRRYVLVDTSFLFSQEQWRRGQWFCFCRNTELALPW